MKLGNFPKAVEESDSWRTEPTLIPEVSLSNLIMALHFSLNTTLAFFKNVTFPVQAIPNQ